MGVKPSNGYKRKQRNSGTRVRKSVVLIATEGKNQTETLYFKDMAKAQGKVVRFVPGNYTDPVNMAQATKECYDEMELSSDLGDCAFCMVDADCDAGKDVQVAVADKIAAEGNFEVVLSVPCFEIWFLCHFGRSTRQYLSNRDVIADLEKKIPGYSKSMAGIYAKTKDRIKDAVGNAKALENACIEAGYGYHTSAFSPSTEAYKVVEELLK